MISIINKLLSDKLLLILNSFLILISSVFLLSYIVEVTANLDYKIDTINEFTIKDLSFNYRQGSEISPAIENQLINKFGKERISIVINYRKSQDIVYSFSTFENFGMVCQYKKSDFEFYYVSLNEFLYGEMYKNDKEIIVDETYARRNFERVNVVGEKVSLTNDMDDLYEIVGVVKANDNSINNSTFVSKGDGELSQPYLKGSIYVTENCFQSLYGDKNYYHEFQIYDLTEDELEYMKVLLGDRFTLDNATKEIERYKLEWVYSLENNISLAGTVLLVGVISAIIYVVYGIYLSDREIFIKRAMGYTRKSIFFETIFEIFLRIFTATLLASVLSFIFISITLSSKGLFNYINWGLLWSLLGSFLVAIPVFGVLLSALPSYLIMRNSFRGYRYEGGDFNE